MTIEKTCENVRRRRDPKESAQSGERGHFASICVAPESKKRGGRSRLKSSEEKKMKMR
jgi:hypothetical protein